MFLPGALYTNLTQVDDEPWQDFLNNHPFWNSKHFNIDEDNKGLAFYVLMYEGELTGPKASVPLPAKYGFDALAVPESALDAIRQEVTDWSSMHAANFGAGLTKRIGCHVIQSGGNVGYHVDGPIYFEGMRADLSSDVIHRAIIETQAARRTILPLRFNADDRLLVCGTEVPLVRGQLFEFSNVLPHAFINSGPEPSVLLITTYLVEELLPPEFYHEK